MESIMICRIASTPLARTLVGVALMLIWDRAAAGANGTWAQANSGSYSWDDTLNNSWISNTPADGFGATANFSAVNLSGEITVNLDVTGHTIGKLIFGDTDTSSAGGWTIAGPNSLSLDNTGSGTGGVITVNALGANKVAIISSPIFGSGITKAGVGTLVLNSTSNSLSGGITISGGTLQGSVASLGANDILDNANLTLDSATVDNFANTISGSGGLTKSNSGSLTLSLNQTYTGPTVVKGGALIVNGALQSTSLNLGSGSLSLALAAGNPVNFTAGTTVSGAGNLDASVVTGTVALGAITRTSGGALNFVLPTTIGTVTTTSANIAGTGILGGWATVGGASFAVSAGDGVNAGAITALANYTANIWAAGNNTDVTSSISPAGGSHTNTLRFNTAAAIAVTLSGSNTVDGGGILETATVANNATSISGGTLLGPVGGDLIFHQFNTANSLTINSTIANNGVSPSGLVKSGGGTVILAANNSYTGNTTIGAGTLQVGNGGSTGTINTTGIISNNGTLAFNRSGSLSLTQAVIGNGATSVTGNFNLTADYTSAAAPTANMLTTGALTLAGGTLNIVGKANTTNSQAFSGTTFGAGTSTISISSGVGGAANLALNGLTRTANVGSTVQFTLPTSGSITTSAAPSQLLNAGGRPYATVADNSGNTFDFAAVDGNGNIVPALTSGVITPGGTNTATLTATVGGSGIYLFNDPTNSTLNRSSGNITVLSFMFNTPSATGWNVLLGGTTNTTSRVTTWSNVFVTSGAGATNENITSGTFRINGEATLFQYDTLGLLTIGGNGASINNTGTPGSLTKTGPGTTVISAAATYAGQTYLNGGTLQIGADNNVGAAQLNLNGGTLLGSSTFTTSTSRTTVLQANGGGLAATTGSMLTIGGVISGTNTGPLTIGIPASNANGNTIGLLPGTGAGTANATPVSATGSVALVSANTYTGGTFIASGTLLAANTTGSATGAGAVTVNSTGIFGGSGTIAGALTVANGGHLASGTVGVNSGIGNTLTVGGLNFQSGSIYDVDIGSTGNDLVTSTNGLVLDPAGGVKVNLFQAGTTNSFPSSAVLNLFNITSGAIPSDASLQSLFTISNPLPGGTYTWGHSGTDITLTVGGLAAGSTWKLTTGGSWNGGTANWDPVQPSHAGDSARFTNSIGNAAASITLDGDRTVGSITFDNNQGGSYTIQPGSPSGNLVMDAGGSSASIGVANGSHTIAAGLVLNSNTTLSASHAADTLTVSGNISGTKDVTVGSGAGTVILTGTNSYANTAILAGGTLQVGNNAAAGTLGTGNISLGGSLVIKRPDPVVIGGSITGAGTLVQSGAGSTTVSSTGNSGTWGTTVGSGSLVVGTGSALGTGPISTTGGVLDLDGYSPSTSSLSGNGGTIDNVTAGGGVTITANQTANSTFGGTIANTSGTVALVKTGAGNLTLAGTGTYDGGTTVLGGGGAITVTSSTALKAGSPVTIQNPGGLLLGGAATNVAANISLQPSGSNQSMFDVTAGSHVTLSGTTAFSNIGGGSARFSAGNDPTTTDLTLTGIFGNTNGSIIMERGSIILAGNSTFNATGNVGFGRSGGSNVAVVMKNNAQLVAPSVTLGVSGATTTSVTFTIQDNGLVNSTGNFDFGGQVTTSTANLNGGTIAAGGLIHTTGTGIANFNGTQITATQANPTFFSPGVALTANVQAGGVKINSNGFDIGIAQSFTHDPALDATTPTPDGGLTKSGAGTLTLQVPSSYTGPTTISGGTLSLQGGELISTTNKVVLAGGKLDTQGISQTFTVAPLQLTASSSIDLGVNGTNDALHFADSSNATTNPWNSTAVLRISNWTHGTLGIDGDHITFDTLSGAATGLSSTQLSQVHFTGFYGGASLTVVDPTTKELVPANLGIPLVRGDLTNDKAINASDLTTLVQALTNIPAYEASNPYGRVFSGADFADIADINADGTVDNTDLQTLITDLISGTPLPSAIPAGRQEAASTVPEPSTAVLICLGGVLLLPRKFQRRRRQV
jgi:fibronectin-binding autotransporter adhesin